MSYKYNIYNMMCIMYVHATMQINENNYIELF